MAPVGVMASGARFYAVTVHHVIAPWKGFPGWETYRSDVTHFVHRRRAVVLFLLLRSHFACVSPGYSFRC